MSEIPQAFHLSGVVLTESTEKIDLNDVVRRLPKVDLHRHLEGSIRLSTLTELVREFDLDLPRSPEGLRKHVQIRPGEPNTPSHFLSKFKVLRMFYQSPRVIERITSEAIEDASADGIIHLELRFTPVALSNSGMFPFDDVFSCVIDTAKSAAEKHEISVGLIASINRHESIELAQEVVRIAVDHADEGIVGLGLAGEEESASASSFVSIFSEANRAGLGITIHAGEWTDPTSIRDAIETLGASRIGHGIRVMEDADLVREVRERKTVFEVCLTSNHQSGAVPSLNTHPLPSMIDAGLQVTLNSDDPGISNILLSDDYYNAIDRFGLSLETLKGLILVGAQAAFLSKKAKKQLELSLMESFF